MKVVIRADASVQIGTGHLMRCLTLAEALKARGATVSFICLELPENLCLHVESTGFPLYRLHYEDSSGTVLKSDDLYAQWLRVPWQTDAKETKAILGGNQQFDLLVVDHYALDNRWESIMRPHVNRIMVIDDLANRSHDCDILLDQNLAINYPVRYADLVPDECRLFLGPRFALLRQEFHAARRSLKMRSGRVSRILVFFGGSDPSNETGKALKALREIGQPGIAIDVVVGTMNPNMGEIKNLCGSISNATLQCGVETMARLMSDANLALGAGGMSMLERCYMGLPSIVLVLAENQAEGAAGLHDAGAIRNLGWGKDITVDALRANIQWALENPALLRDMGQAARNIMKEVDVPVEHPVLKVLLGTEEFNGPA